MEPKTSRKNHTLSYVQRRQLEDFIRNQKNLLGDKAFCPDLAHLANKEFSFVVTEKNVRSLANDMNIELPRTNLRENPKGDILCRTLLAKLYLSLESNCPSELLPYLPKDQSLSH